MTPDSLEFGDVYGVDIHHIIAEEAIVTDFQPIFSTRVQAVIGVEALSRGFIDGRIIPPIQLFNAAHACNRVLEIDRLCRKKALAHFVDFHKHHPDVLLFMNMDSTVMRVGVLTTQYLINSVESIGLSPRSIVLEINESKIDDFNMLKDFISACRKHGFLIALDDVGSERTHWNRLYSVKPDIIKVDRSILHKIDASFYQQEMLNSLVRLSKKIGALTIVEGIETEKEAIIALDLDVQMLQGFYFSKPAPIKYLALDALSAQATQSHVAHQFKQYISNRIIHDDNLGKTYDTVMTHLIRALASTPSHLFDEALTILIPHFEIVESAYILNTEGIQITKTQSPTHCILEPRHHMFHAGGYGTNHSLKNFYFKALYGGTRKFITEPYVSIATGKMCRTIVQRFQNAEDQEFILCIDTPHLLNR